MKISLPTCEYRGEQNEHGRYPCQSPCLITNPKGVSPSTCSTCSYANKSDCKPSLLTQAVNFGSAILSHIGGGLKTVPQEEFERRLNICKTSGPEGSPCEHYRGDNKCGLCGCNMDIKANWAEQKCPVGKWEGYHPPNNGPNNE